MKQVTLTLLLGIFGLLMVACEGADSTSDGDVFDGDLIEGDETDGDEIDGDEPTDGDVPVDGDKPDGDFVDGDIIDGDAPDGDEIDGDLIDGDIIDGDVADGDLIDGDLVDGDLIDGDVTDGDLIDGDLVDGDIIDGDIIDGDVADGDLIDGDIIDGDATDGDLVDVELEAFDGLLMFTTLGAFSGDLGGLAGADAICTQEAQNAGYEGHFVAFLSTGDIDAKDRIEHEKYYFRNGALFMDATNGYTFAIEKTPDVDAFGNSLAPSFAIWTATNDDGTQDENFGTCEDWTTDSGSFTAKAGKAVSIPEWLYIGVYPCNMDYLRLYCFEVAGQTDGDFVDGDLIDSDFLDGDVGDGDLLDGDVVDGDAIDGDVTDGDTDLAIFTLINNTDLNDTINVVVFQENVSALFGDTVIAWRVIRTTGNGDQESFLFSSDNYDISASDSYGNYMPLVPASPGSTYAVVMSPSGHVLEYFGPAPSPSVIELRNDLTQGSINGQLYHDDHLCMSETSIVPAQKTQFQSEPAFYIGVVDGVVEGDVLSADQHSSVTTKINAYGIRHADIVMEYNDPDFQFTLQNVVY